MECEHGDSDLQAQGLATHRVEERQRGQLVVRDLRAVLLDGRTDLRAQLVLDVLVLAEQMEDAREGVGGGVHAREDKRATVAEAQISSAVVVVD